MKRTALERKAPLKAKAPMARKPVKRGLSSKNRHSTKHKQPCVSPVKDKRFRCPAYLAFVRSLLCVRWPCHGRPSLYRPSLGPVWHGHHSPGQLRHARLPGVPSGDPCQPRDAGPTARVADRHHQPRPRPLHRRAHRRRSGRRPRIHRRQGGCPWLTSLKNWSNEASQ